jgi:hypothetical protein
MMPSGQTINDNESRISSARFALAIERERRQNQRMTTAVRQPRREHDHPYGSPILGGNEATLLRLVQNATSLADPYTGNHLNMGFNMRYGYDANCYPLPNHLANMHQLNQLRPPSHFDFQGFQGNKTPHPNLLLAGSIQNRVQSQTGSIRNMGIPIDLAIETDASVTEAYERGRSEAMISLLQSGVVSPAVAMAMSKVQSIEPQKARDDSSALERLGSATIDRRKKNAPYFDASALEDPDKATLSRRRTRGGVTEPFPEKLHRMIQQAENNGKEDCISFFGHGRAFIIKDQQRFCKEIMPKFFKQSRLSSFQRQLNLYGFRRISSGPDAGGYFHELFLKGRPALAIHMRRVGVTQAQSADRKLLRNMAPKTETPDFYRMGPVKQVDGFASGPDRSA